MEPSIRKVIFDFNSKIFTFADTVQIGRTHGQHALPITVGFWLATINQRIFFNYSEMRRYAAGLVGKISGAVGAYNAQRGLRIYSEGENFEVEVLKKLGLKAAPISTQILPPESLAYFLFSCIAMSASLGQFGRDCRQLMRSEIGEIAEAFSADQVGSSTMAHKRNPINFENLEGTWLKNKNEFGKVLDTLISEHQRDLVGSCISRDFPTILINLQQQLNTLLRPSKSGGTFLSNITVDVENCRKNLAKSQDFILAEPLYIALQMAGYHGDAHHFVNHALMPIAKQNDVDLFEAMMMAAKLEPGLSETIAKIPEEVKTLLKNPDKYTGFATEKALNTIDLIEEQFKNWDLEDEK